MTPERPEPSFFVDQPRLDECLEEARSRGVEDVLLRGAFRDLRFLHTLPRLRHLHLGQQETTADVSAVEELIHLESLFTANSPHALDLHELLALRRLTYSVASRTIPPGDDSPLEVVGLSHCSPTSGDLSWLPGWRSVRELHVCVGSLRSLDGLERLRALESLRIARLPRLTDVRALARVVGLRRLVIQDCASALDVAVIGDCGGLRELVITCRAKVDDLRFLRRMKNLETVDLARLDVENGDLSPLLGMPRARITPFRRHYRPDTPLVRTRLTSP